jgi:hypothetical protein
MFSLHCEEVYSANCLKEKTLLVCIKNRKEILKGGDKNMNKKILTLSALAMGVGSLFVTTSSVLAYRGDPGIQGPNYSEERHEAVTQAFENNDYNAWKENMQGRGRVTQVVNESNFAKFAEMHKLMLEGKTEEANAIRTELGLGLQDGSGQNQGMGYGRNANR